MQAIEYDEYKWKVSYGLPTHGLDFWGKRAAERERREREREKEGRKRDLRVSLRRRRKSKEGSEVSFAAVGET
jgi:hypothetical protein